MEEKRKVQIWVVFFAILIGLTSVNTSVNVYREKTVAYHLVEKEENALYRLKTVALNEINDPFAASFIESEISHIEHGIMLLTPSWFDIGVFIALALGFGYLCYKLGVITA